LKSVAAWTDALRLTRPGQWPILSAQLAVGVILSRPSGADAPAILPLVAAWLGWVVLLNGGTLAFNSAYDRDTGPVAYLRRPPRPPGGLAQWSLARMLTGALVGWVGVDPRFGAITLVCVGLSVLYSHPATRWKSRPGLDLLVNMLGYGAGTTLAGLLAGFAAGWGDNLGNLRLVGGFALLFGSFYPLTQIYQCAEDRARGDRTLATALGQRGSLALALLLGLGAAGLLLTMPQLEATADRLVLIAALTGWLLHLVFWWSQAPGWPDARHERGMYHALVLWSLVDLALVVPRLM